MRRRPFGENFVLKQMGRGFVKIGGAETDPEDIRLVEEAWAEARTAIYSGEWDMVVLDEINYAIGYKMLDPAVVAEALRGRPEMVHVILTGRNAHPLLVETGRHGDGDARGEARLSEGNPGAARHRILMRLDAELPGGTQEASSEMRRVECPGSSVKAASTSPGPKGDGGG